MPRNNTYARTLLTQNATRKNKRVKTMYESFKPKKTFKKTVRPTIVKSNSLKITKKTSIPKIISEKFDTSYLSKEHKDLLKKYKINTLTKLNQQKKN